MSVTKFATISRKLNRRGVRLLNIYNNTISIMCVCGKIKSGDLQRVFETKKCIFCNSRRSESVTRKIYEKLTGKEFKNCRPKWLQGLELDGYNEELKIAFEYNGVQHYKYIPEFFHKKGIQTFIEQLKRDELKKNICLSKGVDLHIIPYTLNYKNEEQLEDFIQKKIQTNKLINNKNNIY